MERRGWRQAACTCLEALDGEGGLGQEVGITEHVLLVYHEAQEGKLRVVDVEDELLEKPHGVQAIISWGKKGAVSAQETQASERLTPAENKGERLPSGKAKELAGAGVCVPDTRHWHLLETRSEVCVCRDSSPPPCGRCQTHARVHRPGRTHHRCLLECMGPAQKQISSITPGENDVTNRSPVLGSCCPCRSTLSQGEQFKGRYTEGARADMAPFTDALSSSEGSQPLIRAIATSHFPGPHSCSRGAVHGELPLATPTHGLPVP